MRDSRNGSYALMGGCIWTVAKCAAIGRLGELAGSGGSVWAAQASSGAGPAIVVAQGACLFPDVGTKLLSNVQFTIQTWNMELKTMVARNHASCYVIAPY